MADLTRRVAYRVLRDVEEHKAYSNFALISNIRKYNPPNQPFLRELVYGTLRYTLYLDHIIGNFVKTPIKKLLMADKIILRMGLYQLLFMNSVPDYAAVDECVELAKKYSRGHESFINGVLRQYLRDKEYVSLPDRSADELEYLSIKYSFAKWIVEQWIEEFGVEETEILMDSLNKTPRLCIRANSTKISAEDLKARLIKQKYEVETDEDCKELLYVKGENIIALKMYEDGLFAVQDKGSQTVVKYVDAKPGDTIIDVCAAPGGKAMAMAENMENIGKVIAQDIYTRKISMIEHEAERLGVKIVDARSWDATKTDSNLIGIANKVLVDAPCSGFGTVRRKPEGKYKEFDQNMKELPQKQLDILKASSYYVKSGGILVYSTCTIGRRENKDVIKAFIKENKQFEVLDRVQLTPNGNNTDGFFVCKMKRKESLV